MAVQFIVDTGCDMTQQQAQSLGITLIPMKIRFGDEEFLPGFNLSHEDFYDRLSNVKELPTTSQPSPYDYLPHFQTVRDNGDQAVVICISSALSGTYQSACIAAEDFSDCIYVIDSMSASIGQRILLERAFALRQEGLSAFEIATTLEKEKNRIKIFGAVETLEYLVKGGRLSKAAGIAGSVLGVRPVLTLQNGKLQVLGKARGAKLANAMINSAIETTGIDRTMPAMLGYTGSNCAVLETYLTGSEYLWGSPHALPSSIVGSTIGCHAGPGMIAVAFFGI